MLFLLGSFIAGVLTVLAPCVLPLLPIVIGGSLGGDSKNASRPLIITASLAVSLMVFTLLLKATTIVINIPPQVFTYASGLIIIGLGLFILFPQAYTFITTKLGVEQKSQGWLSQGARQKKTVGAILTGAALGPVFASCSPVYAYILATILPVNLGQALIYMVSYILGLSLMLLLIGFLGQKAVRRVRFAANPRGIFQRTLAIIFVLVGLLIITGYDKRVQVWVSAHTPFNFDQLSATLLPSSNQPDINSEALNVTPYPAPELVGLQDWINSNPTTLQQLRGKVVLVDFWTYSCINCIRALPHVEQWYEQYKDQGLVVLGIHAPEFSFEQKPENVRQAVTDDHLTYPIALDNTFATWNAFHNQYWPASYLIDAHGQIRRVHYGEGEYDQTEIAIRQLLQEAGATVSSKMVSNNHEAIPVVQNQTPETYLGTNRASNYAGHPALGSALLQTFQLNQAPALQHWSLGGTWQVDAQSITARGHSSLNFSLAAKEVYLVGGANSPQNITVKLDSQPISLTGHAGSDVHDSQVLIHDFKLYRLVAYPQFNADSLLELDVPDGVQLNVFTFGG